MEALKSVFGSPAVNMFLGTLPLLGAIVWGLQNDKRLNRMETRMDSMDADLTGVRERLVRVETRLENGQVILGR